MIWMLFKSIAPPKVTKLEFDFMKSINPAIEIKGEESINFSYISLSAEAKQYSIGHCQTNVALKVHKDNGYIVAGWCIWKSPVLLEAEYHQVWLSPKGEIQDITPKSDGGEYILFVFDPRREYEGYPIQNKRKILLDIPEVHEMLKLQDQIYQLQKKYWVPYEDRIEAPTNVIEEFYSLQKKLQLVTFQIENFLKNSSGKK